MTPDTDRGRTRTGGAAIAVAVVCAVMTACAAERPPAETTARRPATDQHSSHPACVTAHERLADRDYVGAAEAFDRCAAASPTDAYAYYYAGMAYREFGRVDLMTLRFERFIELAPDAPERPRVQAMLRNVSR